MMSSLFLLVVLLVYLGLLFVAAQWAEKKSTSRWTSNPYIYSLSLAVYCSAWTYYGSIGVAADSGLYYLPIYLGPVIIFPAWVVILKKIIRISRVNKISSIADFISLRYGNSRFLGALVTVISVLAILPYIGLQLKAIAETFHVVTETTVSEEVLFDSATYVAIVLAGFSSFYGTRYVDASEKRKGIVTVVALESVVKLVFFVILGVYVSFFVFNGFQDIYDKASKLEHFAAKNTVDGLEGGMNWLMLCLMSMFVIFLLPRQFHMGVVENNRETHVRTAIWLFPLYLLIFNLFVFPIAWGGNALFDGQDLNSDMYSLLIPMAFKNHIVTLVVFLGGFSAAISMIVVASITLSTMLSNNLLIPYGFLGSLQRDNPERNTMKIVNIRRTAIFSLIVIAYIYYRYFILDFTLVSVGMISFVLIAQMAPAFFGALFWKRGSRRGAIAAMIAGILVCVYTLLLPFFLGSLSADHPFISDGPFGISLLKPLQLFGLDYLEPIPHAFFWSMLVNTITYMLVSVSFKADYRERNYAEMYVDINKYITNHENAFVWKGTAYVRDIEKVLKRFLGEERTRRALRIFFLKYNISANNTMADARLIKFAENLLTGHIGTASARILIQSVTKEDKISLPEVLQILEESKENLMINKKLRETSRQLEAMSAQLREANASLIRKDKQKDEFLDTVTHELRTPITAIRAAGEILHDDDDLPDDLKKQFLQNIISESDRLNRLIDKILDMERFESGRQNIHPEQGDLVKTVQEAVAPLRQLMSGKIIAFDLESESPSMMATYDHERVFQVVTNLLGNAIKFCREPQGIIRVRIAKVADAVRVEIFNNGRHINENEMEAIFDKFYQAEDQNVKKPVGSGLGLAISRQIISLHGGTIWAKNQPDGVSFYFTIPDTKHEKDPDS